MHENYVKFNYQCPWIKCYLNTAIPTYLPSVFDSLTVHQQSSVTVAERTSPIKLQIFTNWPLQKEVADTCLKVTTGESEMKR